MANPGYDKQDKHPWQDIFVAMPDDTFICGPCLPDDVDPAAADVEVWSVDTDGWTEPVVCCKCKKAMPVTVNGLDALVEEAADKAVRVFDVGSEPSAEIEGVFVALDEDSDQDELERLHEAVKRLIWTGVQLAKPKAATRKAQSTIARTR